MPVSRLIDCEQPGMGITFRQYFLFVWGFLFVCLFVNKPSLNLNLSFCGRIFKAR